ncbi:MAG: Methyltransferase domain [Gaiellaceae bacterium]|nr:Methyltransferase domain [Gaiellaceae bacterium]
MRPSPVRLPPDVILFRLRAIALALRTRDISRRSPLSFWRLSRLLALARGRDRIVELGTAAGWTAYSLALSNPRARVKTYDRVARAGRDRYRRLVPSSALERVDLILRRGEDGPESPTSCDLLLIDADHWQPAVREMFDAWYGSVVPGGLVVFDDVAPEFPDVAQTIADLGLSGERLGRLFVHVKPTR